MEKSMPLFLIFPILMIGGSAELAVAGVLGSNNRLLLLRRYRSALKVPRPSRNSRSNPTFTDRFSSHFRRSEEHTSELQSLAYLVCRLLLEKKKKKQPAQTSHALVRPY